MIDHSAVRRKDEHLALIFEDGVRSTANSGLDDYRFEHNALPEMDFAEVDTSVEFLGHKMHMPLMISPITGGGDKSEKINKGLAELANDFNIGFSVGSQSIAIVNKSLEKSFKIRNYAPNVLLFANLGAVQLNYGYSVDECRRAVDMIDADALILHINPLQEVFQPEGNTDFSNLLKKIERICSALEVAVGIKEVGYGISASLAKKLCDVGVRIIDVAGTGSISWSAIESSRTNDVVLRHSSNAFLNWGNSTAECLSSIPEKLEAKIIASGAVRTGVDMAKALALGADMCGNASDFLRRIVKSRVECENFVESLTLELKTAMFCTGCKNIRALKSAKLLKIA
ncbi:MAG: type 2 isopentenyl-diphosphate Delta-isomerase [Holosporaceae bacterium]|nr:type 2 isopentenyl-diphosphate Delta-isomerase [Holosporaceae bacterium]